MVSVRANSSVDVGTDLLCVLRGCWVAAWDFFNSSFFPLFFLVFGCGVSASEAKLCVCDLN